MSRYNSPEVVLRRRQGYSGRRALQEVKRLEAEERNALTLYFNRRAWRRSAAEREAGRA